MGLRDFQARRGGFKPQAYRFPADYPVQVQFARELTDALYVVEHSNPDNWTQWAECTFPECYGCEQNRATVGWSDWAQRPRLYIDARIDGSLEVICQTLTPSMLAPKLEAYYLQHGTICGILFNVTRTGQGKKTKYLLDPVDDSPRPLTSNLRLRDYLTSIPYAAQEHYYNK